VVELEIEFLPQITMALALLPSGFVDFDYIELLELIEKL
jgi:hypothetical protein